MKIFLDTNVLVSSVATRGLCADVAREVLSCHQLVISDTLIKELKRIIREKLGLPNDLISDFIQLIEQEAIFSNPTGSLDIDIQDKDDLPLLASALEGNVDLFITGDQELLELKKIGNLHIVSPRGFWEKLKECNN